MYLQNMKIKNWQCIISTNINFRSLMLFIGQSNSGKSSILAGIMYFLNCRNLRKSDFRQDSNFIEMEGTFVNNEKLVFNIDGEEIFLKKITLKIHKNIKRDAIYYIKKNRSWEEISYESYQKIVEKIKVIFIPTICTADETQYFINSILNNLDTSEDVEKTAIEKVVEIFHELRLEYTSHGFYRNLIFEIIKEIAIVSKKINKEILPNVMIIFEEPELYLHPQREKELFACFTELKKYGVTFYITTHSSNFVSLQHYRSICIVRKNEEFGSRVFQYSGKLFKGDEVQNFNMNYWINPDRSALFFAKKVILVEGQTDKVVLGYLAKEIGTYKYDYSIIECGSKSVIPQFIRLLNAFKIPYVAVYDKDNHSWRTEDEKCHCMLQNRGIQKLINKKLGKYIEFENDIEEEIQNEGREKKNYKNKPFAALMTVMDKKYVIPKKFKKKIRKIFD